MERLNKRWDAHYPDINFTAKNLISNARRFKRKMITQVPKRITDDRGQSNSTGKIALKANS